MRWASLCDKEKTGPEIGATKHGYDRIERQDSHSFPYVRTLEKSNE